MNILEKDMLVIFLNLLLKLKNQKIILKKQQLKHNIEIQTLISKKDKLQTELTLQKDKYEHDLLKKEYEILL